MRTNKFLRWTPVLLFGLAIGIFLILFFRYQKKPEITGMDHLMAASGDKLEISGRYFGDGIDGSKLYIGPNALTSSGIIEWDDTRILARVPRNDGAVLVKVKTRSGTSHGVVLGDASRFPRVDYGPWLPGAPFIEYAELPAGGPGTLVTLHGEGFGNRRGGGRIWVNRSDSSSLLGTEEPDLTQYVEAMAIDRWTDKLVRFWIPQGSSTGNIYLLKGGQFSNPVSIELSRSAGSLKTGVGVQWSLRQDIVIDRIGSFPGNSLYLHIPSPQPGSGQGEAVILVRSGDSTPVPLRIEGNLATYRMDELEPGSSREVSRQIIVTATPLRAGIVKEFLVSYDPSHPELADALVADKWIRPDLVPRTTARVIGNLRDDWSKSRAVYDYILELLSWDENPPSRVIPDYISTAAADSEGYSYLFVSMARAAKIPARPVGGIIVLNDGTTRSWWWAEVWMEGVGWIPVDPALGDGGDNIVLSGVDGEAADYYFGGLEGRHIAFSRGVLPSGPLQPDPELRIPDGIYTLQGAWEEVSGNLDSYKSFWPIPRVTASYSQSDRGE